jgi:hypothetical protein
MGPALEIPDPLAGWDASLAIRGEVSLEQSISEHARSIGHGNAGLKSVSFRRPDDLERSELQALPEQAQLLGVHISQGLNLIRAGNYESAVSHFSRADVLKTCGFSLGEGNYFHKRLDTLNGSDLNALITDVAMRSWFMHDSKTVIPSFATVEKASGELTERERRNLREFNRELCLIYAEEWTHAFQHAMGTLVSQKGELIQNLPIRDANSFSEFDVAEFMSEQRIPLSPTFMDRYGRDHVHEMLRNYSTKAEQNEIRSALALANVGEAIIIGRDPLQYHALERDQAAHLRTVTLQTPTNDLPIPQIGVRDAFMDRQIANAHVRLAPQGDGTYMVEPVSTDPSHRIFTRDTHRIWRELSEPQAIQAGTAVRLGTSFEFKLP